MRLWLETRTCASRVWGSRLSPSARLPTAVLLEGPVWDARPRVVLTVASDTGSCTQSSAPPPRSLCRTPATHGLHINNVIARNNAHDRVKRHYPRHRVYDSATLYPFFPLAFYAFRLLHSNHYFQPNSFVFILFFFRLNFDRYLLLFYLER